VRRNSPNGTHRVKNFLLSQRPLFPDLRANLWGGIGGGGWALEVKREFVRIVQGKRYVESHTGNDRSPVQSKNPFLVCADRTIPRSKCV